MILKFLYAIIEQLAGYLYKLLKILTRQTLTMSAPIYDNKGRFLLYYAKNNKLLYNYKIMKMIFYNLQQEQTFRSFGSKKIIYVNCFIDGKRYSFHRNVLISNNMVFSDYWNKISSDLMRHSENSIYWLSTFERFEIRIWNLDLPSNSNIKTNQSSVETPLTDGVIKITLKASGFPLNTKSYPKASGFLLGTSSYLRKGSAFLLGSTSYLVKGKASGFHLFLASTSYNYKKSGFLLGSVFKTVLFMDHLDIPVGVRLVLHP